MGPSSPALGDGTPQVWPPLRYRAIGCFPDADPGFLAERLTRRGRECGATKAAGQAWPEPFSAKGKGAAPVRSSPDRFSQGSLRGQPNGPQRLMALTAGP